jgi:hypothetical protein
MNYYFFEETASAQHVPPNTHRARPQKQKQNNPMNI